MKMKITLIFFKKNIHSRIDYSNSPKFREKYAKFWKNTQERLNILCKNTLLNDFSLKSFHTVSFQVLTTLN